MIRGSVGIGNNPAMRRLVKIMVDTEEIWDLETWQTVKARDPIWFLYMKKDKYEPDQGVVEQQERKRL